MNVEDKIDTLSDLPQKYVVCRPVYRSDDFKKEFREVSPSPLTPYQKVKKYVRKSCTPSELLQSFLGFFPVFRWLPRYRISECLLADISAGITVFVVQLPQGIAFGKIAGLTPMQGIYSSCFPLLSYFLMSNSRCLSVGPTPSTAILLASIIYKHTSDFVIGKSSNQTVDFINATENDTIQSGYSNSPTPLEVAVIVTFVAGIYQILLGIFRLECLFVYFSKPLTGGFIFAVVIKLFIQELSDAFGIETKNHSGSFDTIYFLIDFFQHITTINWVTTVVTVCSLAVIFLVRQYLSPYLQKKCKIPIPIELVVVIVATVASEYLRLHSEWNVKTVGILQTGILAPRLPSFELFTKSYLDSLGIAIVSLCFAFTVNNIFAAKYKEEIENNKEFIALGVSNIVSSLFSGMVISGALGRSMIQEAVGGKTQIVGIVTFVCFVLSLLVMGRSLKSLPECVLSAIIIMAMKDLLITARDFCKLWKSYKLDAMLWLVTFLATVIIDVINGMWVGLGFNLLLVLYRIQIPKSCLLGVIPKTNIYVPLHQHKACRELPNVKIFRFGGSLLCNSIQSFSRQLATKSNINVSVIAKKQKKTENKLFIIHGENSFQVTNDATVQSECTIPKHVIIDCSAICDVDTTGLKQLLDMYTTYRSIEIELILADCNDSVYGTMERSDFFKTFPSSNVYLSIHDAVLNITSIGKSTNAQNGETSHEMTTYFTAL